MENTNNGATKIIIGDLELWTAPFGEKKATISAVEEVAKKALILLHEKMPESFEVLVDEADFCEEDTEGVFSVIVDPEKVCITVYPGAGKMGFTVSPDCEGDCEHCEFNCDHDHEKEDTNE